MISGCVRGLRSSRSICNACRELIGELANVANGYEGCIILVFGLGSELER